MALYFQHKLVHRIETSVRSITNSNLICPAFLFTKLRSQQCAHRCPYIIISLRRSFDEFMTVSKCFSLDKCERIDKHQSKQMQIKMKTNCSNHHLNQ